MKHMNKFPIVVFSLLLLSCQHLSAQHLEVLVYDDSGTLGTGTADIDDNSVVTELRVSRSGPELQVGSPSFLYGGHEPGFNATAASLLPPNKALNFNVIPITHPISGVARNLWFWNGLDDDMDGNYEQNVSFGAAPVDVFFKFSKSGGNEAIVDGAADTVSGFTIDSTDGTGLIHKHISFSMWGQNQQPASHPPDGIYLVALELLMEGLNDSDPMFMIYNLHFIRDHQGQIVMSNPPTFTPLLNLDSEAAAAGWVQDQLINAGSLVGDFNNDAAVNDLDIDLLRNAILSGTSDAIFNLDDAGGNVPDAGDYDFLIENIIGTGRGDSDLNKVINFLDFTLLSNNFEKSGTNWKQGNYNIDSVTNFFDFVELSNQFGMDFRSWGADEMPEPTTLAMLCLGGLASALPRRLQNI